MRDEGTAHVLRVYIVGDLTGVPVLKFSADSGARAVQHLLLDPRFLGGPSTEEEYIFDLIMIGAGSSGLAAGTEPNSQALKLTLIESSQAFSAPENFPNGQPIYTHPTDIRQAGD